MGIYEKGKSLLTRFKYKTKNLKDALNSCLKESQHCPCSLGTELPNVPLQLLQAHSHPLPRGCWFLGELAASLSNDLYALWLNSFPPSLRAHTAWTSPEHTTLTTHLPYAHQHSSTASMRSSEQETLSSRKGYWKQSSLAIYKYACQK